MKKNGNRKQIIQILSFYLHKKLFAIPVDAITEVNRIARISYCANVPDHVLGLINLHGVTTPILNMKQLLKIESSNFDPPAMWIGIKHDKLAACLAVDKLSGFWDLEEITLDEIPTLADSPDMRYIKCFAKIDHMLTPVLNVTKIISEKEKKILKGLAKQAQIENNGKN